MALVHGRAGPLEFSDAATSEDVKVAKTRDIISVRTDDNVRDDEAILYFPSKSGPDPSFGTRVIHIKHATGSLHRPMTKIQLEAKFLDQAVGCVGEAKAKKAVEVCSSLESVDDVTKSMELFTS